MSTAADELQRKRRGASTKKLTLYVPVDKQLLVDNVRGPLKREKSSISRFLIEKLEEYWTLHEPGNPQQRIDVILRLGKAYHAPSPICGFKNCYRDAVAVGHFKPNGRDYGLCVKHKGEAQENPQAWMILSEEPGSGL